MPGQDEVVDGGADASMAGGPGVGETATVAGELTSVTEHGGGPGDVPARLAQDVPAAEDVPAADDVPAAEDVGSGRGGQELIELVVSEVRAAVPLRPGQEAGLAVLAEAGEPFRSLHIYIGQPEARAIQAGQRGERPSRPGTWDLLLAAVEALGGSLEYAVVDSAEEGRHFYASIWLRSAGGLQRVPCRPSDAVALVVRASGAALYATAEVLDSAGRYP